MSVRAARFLIPGPGEQFGWGLGLSFGLHLILVAVLMFWPGWKFSRREIFNPVYRVNLVGAPRLPSGPPGGAAPKPAVKPAIKAAPKPSPIRTSPAKPKPKPREAIGTKKTVKTKRIERKKAKSTAVDSRMLDRKINRLKRRVAQDRRLDKAINRLERRVAARVKKPDSGAYATAGAGVASAGTTGAGAGAGQGGRGGFSMRFNIYYTELWERIRRQWVLPEALVEKPKGLLAVVVMRINKNGGLDKVWLEQNSGNSRYDQSCLRAAERAAPFPPLPAGIRDRTHEVGVRFSAEDING